MSQTKAQRNAWVRAYYRSKVERGECIRCPERAVDGRRMCAPCAIKHRTKRLEYYYDAKVRTLMGES